MKNKDVENIYEHDSEPMLNYKDLQIVLSYIEQLENNRDKAIEYIEEKGRLKYVPNELINILKGGSDE